MGQNGRLTSTFDGTLHGQFGEDCMAGDLVGVKDNGAGKRLFYKALAAAGGTQIAAVGVCPRDVKAGDWENVRADVWRALLNSALLTGPLANLVGLEQLYLSDSVAGAATRTAPVGVGKIVQRVGISYIDTAERRGVAASEPANAWLVRIEPPVTL
jgi:hypothetical protein